VYSSSGRFHGAIQKSNASLSVRSENVRGDWAVAASGTSAIAAAANDARSAETDRDPAGRKPFTYGSIGRGRGLP
jgi:hypothetical protein